MGVEGTYRLNHVLATGKVIDREAVVINVMTGRYYSLAEAGSVAWTVLTAGGSVHDTVAAITERYDADSVTVTGDVTAVVQDLLSEEVIVAASPEDPIEPPDPTALWPADGALRPYTGARLETFKDMEDLLAFDPPLPQAPPRVSPLPE